MSLGVNLEVKKPMSGPRLSLCYESGYTSQLFVQHHVCLHVAMLPTMMVKD